MVRPAMQEEIAVWLKEKLRPYIRHRVEALACPRALMEFARISVLISLAVSAEPAFVRIRFSEMQNWSFMPSP